MGMDIPTALGIGTVSILCLFAIFIATFNEQSSSDMIQIKTSLKTDAQILEEINQQALLYQDNKENLNEQLALMQKKQLEIASRILGLDISTAHVSDFNFPFHKASDIEPLPGFEQTPMCDIPEKIPAHLEIIRDSEMFQMFAKKYSQYPLSIEISDERRHLSIIHYTISATTEDGHHASTYFHIDSCTGENNPAYYNLHCNDTTKNDFKHAFLLENIVDSLDDDSFCTITFKDWQENLFEYSDRISKESESIHQRIMQATQNNDIKNYTELLPETDRLQLLLRISFEGTRSLQNDSGGYDENISDMISEYNEKFGNLPEELVMLLDARP